MPSLIDQFCPNIHDAPITAAAYDRDSGTIATADRAGLLAVQRPGEAQPKLRFQPGGPIEGAMALIRGGAWVAVGDDHGTVAVYRTEDGEPVFAEERSGERGRIRAMRGVAISPEGGKLAAIAIDGLLRCWDLSSGQRTAWRGFSGCSVAFGPRGDRLLAMDDQGQPRLMDLVTQQALYMDRLQTPAEHACFTPDGTMVVAAGQAGISLLRVVDGTLVASFATRGGSGISNLIIAPDGARVGAVTGRSVHIFTLPGLQPAESRRHGAPNPTGAALWIGDSLRVAGDDGLLHSGGSGAPGPVCAVSGFGKHRIVAHDTRIAYWHGHSRRLEFPVSGRVRQMQVDRDGQLVVMVPEQGPAVVYSCQNGRQVFDTGPSTVGTPQVCVGGSVVAVQLAEGGVRWWDLQRHKGFELKWPRAIALSHGGTWLGVVTPRGLVRILDPATGRDAVTPPTPLAEVPVVNLAFVNRRPDLLVLDQDGVLGHYDLGRSVRDGQPCPGRDILTINVEVDRIWGITGGRACALRLPEGDACTIIWVDLQTCEPLGEITGLHRYATIDPESGVVLQPARSAALLEFELNGAERRVLRSLPNDEWISFGHRGILDNSQGAAGVI